MKRRKLIVFFFIFCFLILSGCSPTKKPASPTKTPLDTPKPTTELTVEPTTPDGTLADSTFTITILYTNDEHGYMEGVGGGVGAAELMGVWEDEFDYTLDGPFLVLSGGDMWTGPAISTWFSGASMVQVMNAMGYDAAAVGNHEFDFGLDQLKLRTEEMTFPLLSANTRYKSDGSIPIDIGITPFALVSVNGVTFGVIGLTLTNTPSVTNPDIVAPFDFIDYETALREIVPQAREAGADIIVVPAHICSGGLSGLAIDVSDLEISMFGGGHCHETFSRLSGDSVLLGGGEHMMGFAFAELEYDPETGSVSILDYGTMDNRSGNTVGVIADLVEEFVVEADIVLAQVIGYGTHRISQRSEEMEKLIAESWLWAFPGADVALTNTGGIRDALPAGDITIGDIITILPFDNTIVQLNLTGEQLEDILFYKQDDLAIGGLEKGIGKWTLVKTGVELDSETIYVVLVNSYMYSGGSSYTFSAYDPDGYDTNIQFRQPLIDWIKAQGSNADDPIDDAIDDLINYP